MKKEIKKVLDIFIYSKSMVPALFLILILLVLFFSFMTENFFSFTNFRAIVSNIPVIAIMAIGMTFVLLIGGLDLSVGSILGITAVGIVIFHHIGLPAWAVIITGLSIGILFGSINGLFITKVGINPVITTLGMLLFARGLASLFALEVEAVKIGRIFDQKFLSIGRMYLPRGTNIIPITLIYVIVLYAAALFILKYTKYGRNIYAVGSNSYSARLAGIKTARIKFLSYMISGMMAALAGIILVAQLSLGRDDAGKGMELQVITAVVLGGVSLTGGRGKLLGVFIAVLILGVISNGMVHLEKATGLPYYWREVVKGAMLILAIAIDALRIRAGRKKQIIRQ